MNDNTKPKPNQLKLIVTNAKSEELIGIIELSAIQNLHNQHGEAAAQKAVFDIFKSLIERLKAT